MRTVTFLVCLFSLSNCKHLPSYVDVCQRKDPQISQCILRNVDKLKPRFNKGLPDLAIPPFNPLRIPQAHFSGGSFNVTFTDIELYNLESFVVDDLKFDPWKPEFKLAVTIPHLRIKAKYRVVGRVLVLQLDGRGPVDGNYTNVNGVLEASGEHYTKNGADFVKLGNYRIDLDIGKPHLQFDNIFGDNKELNDQTNKVFNEHITEVFEELKPLIIEIISQFVFGIESRIFDKYSYDELFPL